MARKFKIGDWVYDTKDPDLAIGKISKYMEGDPYCEMWYSIKGVKGHEGYCNSRSLRLATEQEINIALGIKEFYEIY